MIPIIRILLWGLMQSAARAGIASHTTLIRSIHIIRMILIVIILTTLTILIVVLYAHIVVLYGAHNTHDAAGLALKHMIHLYIIRLQP